MRDRPFRPFRPSGLVVEAAIASGVVALGAIVSATVHPFSGIDPFSLNARALVVGSVASLIIVVVVVVCSRQSPCRAHFAALGIGVLGSWALLTLRVALNGSPYAFGRWDGDAGRIAAMATRFAVAPATADRFAVGVPTEYPPLYPWLVGRIAALTDVDAWRLLGPASALTIAVSLVVSYVLWRRVCPASVAFALSTLSLVAYHPPAKAYVVLALALFVPLVMQVLANPPAGRLHWATAGALLAVVICLYQGPLISGSIGIAALSAYSLWNADDRKGHALYLAKIAGLAFLLSSWYVVPYLYVTVTRGSQNVGDLYVAADMTGLPTPFSPWSILSVIQIAGFLGAVWYWNRRWWAPPIVLLTTGLYLFWSLMMLRFSFTDHTFLFHYVGRVLQPLLVVGGVLTAAELLTRLAESDLGGRSSRRAACAACGVLALWSAGVVAGHWLPSMPGERATDANAAFAQTLPDGTALEFGPAEAATRAFPVDLYSALPIPGTAPLTLSADQDLFAFLPWKSYVGPDRLSSNAMAFWDRRKSEIERLAAVGSPADFAEQSAAMEHGAIDAFVLREGSDGWYWLDVRFDPALFSSSAFEVYEHLPNGLVAVIRVAR